MSKQGAIHAGQQKAVFKICAGGMAGNHGSGTGFCTSVALAETRQYKLLRTRETRNTCTYCSVGCGLLMYSPVTEQKNAKASIFHIEGDPITWTTAEHFVRKALAWGFHP